MPLEIGEDFRQTRAILRTEQSHGTTRRPYGTAGDVEEVADPTADVTGRVANPYSTLVQGTEFFSLCSALLE